MLTKEDLILIRDELQLSIFSCKEFMSNCLKYGGSVPPWVTSRYDKTKICLARINSLLDGFGGGD